MSADPFGVMPADVDVETDDERTVPQEMRDTLAALADWFGADRAAEFFRGLHVIGEDAPAVPTTPTTPGAGGAPPDSGTGLEALDDLAAATTQPTAGDPYGVLGGVVNLGQSAHDAGVGMVTGALREAVGFGLGVRDALQGLADSILHGAVDAGQAVAPYVEPYVDRSRPVPLAPQTSSGDSSDPFGIFGGAPVPTRTPGRAPRQPEWI
jgi:hypothetical protein